RRLAALESDLSGSEEMADRRERQIRESLAGVKALVRRETQEFGKRFALALPGEIEGSKAEDLKRYLPSFMEERFRSFADQQGEELAKRLEKVAEEAIAFVTEDANEQRKKLEELLGGTGPDVDLTVNTLAYDVGVIALGAFGIGIMALSNIFVGGAMTLAAPVLAYFFRGGADREMKKRAMEEAPEAVRQAAGKLAEAFEKQIDEFGDKLVEFVRAANEETTRSIAEVVRAARHARSAGEEELEDLTQTVGGALGRLKIVTDRMATQRRSLWTNGGGGVAAGEPTPEATAAPADEAAAATTTPDEDAVAADLDDSDSDD
ncbi:MAG: hypothetical protein KC619_20650, partial [Myxococcales bacterium]|nr:hypothetical protein [Myxococcales bacterium]